MLVVPGSLYVSGGHSKALKELLTQLLHGFRVSDPTPDVDEVWRFIQILFCSAKVTK